VAALASGGLDSTVLLAHLARSHREVRPLFVRCGLSWEVAEAARLREVAAALGDPRIAPPEEIAVPMGDAYGGAWYATGAGIPGWDEPDERWEIPGRNIILLAKAAVWARLRGIGRIALGILASNPFPDASPEFFAALEAALSRGLGAPVGILRPFAGLGKADVIRLGRDLGLPLGRTLSCARPAGGLHCGTCGKCRERIEGFAAAGVPDPTRYAVRAPAG
jgi:7-cyano-7-deazaguanine synthase